MIQNTGSSFDSENNDNGQKLANKRSHIIKVVCNAEEKNRLSVKAKSIGLSVSEFLRNAGMECKIVIPASLPKEVLLLTVRINNISASLNQLAKWHNQFIPLTQDEKNTLLSEAEELHQLTIQIKKYLK